MRWPFRLTRRLQAPSSVALGMALQESRVDDERMALLRVLRSKAAKLAEAVVAAASK